MFGLMLSLIITQAVDTADDEREIMKIL